MLGHVNAYSSSRRYGGGGKAAFISTFMMDAAATVADWMRIAASNVAAKPPGSRKSDSMVAATCQPVSQWKGRGPCGDSRNAKALIEAEVSKVGLKIDCKMENPRTSTREQSDDRT
jgi:hypothetical protein